MIDETEITLGEVYRNLQEVKAYQAEAAKELVATRIALESVRAQEPRIERLERIVYGTLGGTALAIVGAGAALFTK